MQRAPERLRSAGSAALLQPSGGFILLRLVMFCLVVGAALYRGRPSAAAQILLWAYFAATLTFLLFYRRWRRPAWRRLARQAGSIQILLEVAVAGAVLAESNAFTSPFVLLFILTIVSASLQYRLVGTLLVATSCSVAVTAAVFTAVAEHAPSVAAARHFSTVLEVNDDLFYALFLYVCGFYLAAFVSGYLSEKLELKDRALEGASRALQLARLETDDILRHMQSGLLTLNAHGTVIYFNRTAEEILGLRESDVTGHHCSDIFSGRLAPLGEMLLRALHNEEPQTRTELRLEGKAGRNLPVGISTSMLGTPETGIRGVIAVFQDLTDAKRLEERVRVADRLAAVGELSASIAHEIRNPLATVTGSVEMLRRDAHLDEDGRSLMDMILKESARLNRIVGDFLDFARIRQQSCQEVDLASVAEEVCALFAHHPARRPDSRVQVLCRGERPKAAASRDQVQQMLVNLVQNALEALPESGGRVTMEACEPPVATDARNSFVELAVVDNGRGIAPEVLGRIGQPFFSTKKKGTGLGIAIVQRLAMVSGGSLRWSNEREGGARFTLRLPRFSPEAYLQEVSDLAGANGHPAPSPGVLHSGR